MSNFDLLFWRIGADRQPDIITEARVSRNVLRTLRRDVCGGWWGWWWQQQHVQKGQFYTAHGVKVTFKERFIRNLLYWVSARSSEPFLTAWAPTPQLFHGLEVLILWARPLVFSLPLSLFNLTFFLVCIHHGCTTCLKYQRKTSRRFLEEELPVSRSDPGLISMLLLFVPGSQKVPVFLLISQLSRYQLTCQSVRRITKSSQVIGGHYHVMGCWMF